MFQQNIQAHPLKIMRSGRNSNELVDSLSSFLASTYVLYQKSLFYHWNVVGRNFISLHQLFEEHYLDLQKAGDEIAERIRAIKGYAPGTLKEFLTLSTVQEDHMLPGDDTEMIENLLKNHIICSVEASRVLAVAEEMHDQVSMDLMIRRMTVHDKTAWMLRSILS